jgi:hypothetical protein
VVDSSKYTESNYLKAVEVAGEKLRLKIERVEEKEIRRRDGKPGTETRLVFYFEDEEKAYIPNKTNIGIMQVEFGTETNDWEGQTIILTTVKVRNPQGNMVDGFLIKIPPRATNPPRAAKPKVVHKAEPDPEESENPGEALDDTF